MSQSWWGKPWNSPELGNPLEKREKWGAQDLGFALPPVSSIILSKLLILCGMPWGGSGQRH